jgi:hypothetical protein
MGAKSWKDVLRIRWRISTGEAHRRLTEAALLGPRRSLLGAPLPPVLACTAAAAAGGQITAEHVEVIRKAITKLPGFVDAGTREQFEADLVRAAVGVGPKEVADVAELTVFLLDQDGPEPDDDAGDSPPPEPIGDGGCGAPEPFDPVGNDDADQPGGPAPPDDQAA